MKNLAAVALGSIKSKKKAASSRANGKKGGRPVKTKEDVTEIDLLRERKRLEEKYPDLK